jgi:hypothetical protein
MSENRKAPRPADLLKELENNPELRQKTIAPVQLDSRLLMLRAWQSNRLASTYKDLLESKRYGSACRFILSDIYASKDFSQRDHDINTIYNFLSRVLPPISLQLLKDAIEVNQLTYSLDTALLNVLISQFDVTDSITPEQYARAYQICDNYDERAFQIQSIARTVQVIGEGARWPLVRAAMRIIRMPAIRTGWGELYGFLDRGYRAFKPMRDIKFFVGVIYEREMQILDNLFINKPDPFILND